MAFIPTDVLIIFGSLLSLPILAQAATLEGELRTIYDHGKSRNGIAAGGKIGINHTLSKHLILRATGYTAQPIISGSGLAATGLLEGRNGFSLLGQAHVEYRHSGHRLTVGRQTITSPLVTSQDHILIPGLFSGINYSSPANLSPRIHAFYLTDMSGRDNRNKKSNWVSPSQVLGTSYNQDLFALGIKQQHTPALTTTTWYYAIPATLETLFTSASYKTPHSAYQYEAHYWQSKSGSRYQQNTHNKIDYRFFGVQISRQNEGLTVQLALERMQKTAGSYTIPTAFGNYAEYSYGFRISPAAYGMNIAGSGLNISSMHALKLTARYKLSPTSLLIAGYTLGRSNNRNLQSDMNIFDSGLFTRQIFKTKTTLGIIFENLETHGDGIFSSDNKLKISLKHAF